MHQARNKVTIYWFWQVYILYFESSTLSIKECVLLDDLYDIISFIHPNAIKMIHSDQELKQIYIQSNTISNKEMYWMTTRHDLLYACIFFFNGDN